MHLQIFCNFILVPVTYPGDAETILQNSVNTMAADTLLHCIARPLAINKPFFQRWKSSDALAFSVLRNDRKCQYIFIFPKKKKKNQYDKG